MHCSRNRFIARICLNLLLHCKSLLGPHTHTHKRVITVICYHLLAYTKLQAVYLFGNSVHVLPFEKMVGTCIIHCYSSVHTHSAAVSFFCLIANFLKHSLIKLLFFLCGRDTGFHSCLCGLWCGRLIHNITAPPHHTLPVAIFACSNDVQPRAGVCTVSPKSCLTLRATYLQHYLV